MHNLIKYICVVAIFTALFCVVAPISVPMVPVPITLATLMVYTISALFSLKIAPAITILYIVMGLIGLPVFSNFSSGAAVIAGPTGGYILGYVLAAIGESVLIELFKNKKWMYPVAMLVATALIYLFGTTWFVIYMGGKYTVSQALMACVVPFLIGDSIKIAIASIIGIRLRQFCDQHLGDINVMFHRNLQKANIKD